MMVYVDKYISHMIAASCKGPIGGDPNFNSHRKWLKSNGFRYRPSDQYWVKYVNKRDGVVYLDTILCWPYWAAYIGPSK